MCSRCATIAGIRDKIVNQYFRANTRRIGDVVDTDIDALEDALTKQSGRRAVDG